MPNCSIFYHVFEDLYEFLTLIIIEPRPSKHLNLKILIAKYELFQEVKAGYEKEKLSKGCYKRQFTLQTEGLAVKDKR